MIIWSCHHYHHVIIWSLNRLWTRTLKVPWYAYWLPVPLTIDIYNHLKHLGLIFKIYKSLKFFFFFWKRDRCNISKTRSTKFSVFISVAIILLGCFKVNCYNWRFMYLYNLIVMYIWSGFTNLTIFLLGGLKVNCYN